MKRQHPFWYLVLMLPYGASSGFLQFTLAYLLSQGGMSAQDVAQLGAVGLFPHTWKFFWAPIADAVGTRKRWHWLSNGCNALGILLMSAIALGAHSFAVLALAVLLANIATTFVGMSVEGLMAECTVAEDRGRAAGWFQAGILGGAGVGGGAALWVAKHVQQPWVAPLALALLCLTCSFALRSFVEPVPTVGRSVREGLRGVGRDLWQLLRSRAGLIGLLLSALPINTGAMANLWASAAGSWHASAEVVASVGGLAGFMSIPGCLVGGWLSDRMNRKLAYAAAGATMALSTLAMSIAPRTETTYFAFVSLYALVTGIAWGTFTGFVLELIGHGAAATKYNIFASLSNMPLLYVTVANGWAFEHWGGRGMLLCETVLGAVGIVILVAVVAMQRLRAAPAGPENRS